jgi:iron complex transport system substrate-binding protein
MPRIVSLLPAATEIVHALGKGDHLVGRSHECDYPPEVASLPACTSSKLTLDGTSYDIEQRVKAILQEGLSIYRVDAAQLDALRPDVIITQEQCAVCAANLEDLESAVCEMVTSRPAIVSLNPSTLDSIFADVRAVAEGIAVPERGIRLVDEMRAKMAALTESIAADASTPVVGTIEWMDPMMTGGNWMPELVEMAGGTSAFGTAGQHSPWLAWKSFSAADPDVIVVLPCGYGLAQTRSEIGELTSLPGWESLSAVRDGRVFLTDGHQFFNRPGPRIVQSLQILIEILHPEANPSMHCGTGWEPL